MVVCYLHLGPTPVWLCVYLCVSVHSLVCSVGKDIGALLSNIGSASATASVGGGAPTTTESGDKGEKEEKKEEKKEESEEESDDDMGFGECLCCLPLVLFEDLWCMF